MSEMDEMRREDLRRDEDMGDMGDGRGEPSTGGLREDGATAGTGDLGRDGAASEGRLTTDQIANPGATPAAAPQAGGEDRSEAEAAQLLDPKDREAMTRRWRDIQADFVDQPQKAMQDADALVAGLMQQLAQMFSQERSQLEAQWSRGDQVSTEDLRVSLQRYRAFFERLLSV